MHQAFKIFIAFIALICSAISYTQTVDFESIGNAKPIKVSGQVSASGVYYDSNQNNSREPFTYFLQGTLNFNIYSFSIPVSYSFSNQGENLGYKLPFDFNRISLHPKYKWVTGHIGNVNMSFSPYTLNGHQFTGGGVDVTPPGAFKVSAMSGRLLKAINDDQDPRTVPAYTRMGYGLKTSFEKEKFTIGLIGFYAKDNQNSIDTIPEAKGVLPQENLILSVLGEAKIAKNYTLQAEYAATAITKDLRAEEIENPSASPLDLFFNNRASTAYYNAIKTRFGYTAGRTSVGLAYERIDPGYETLGAYYFNNDFENITLDASNTFFKDKLTLVLNVGYQRDDLDNLKANSTNRTVGSVNATLNLTERLTIAGSYSNFSTFTNIKPNQFDEINDADLLDEELESLDFRQLSQSTNANINYIVSNKKTSRQNLSFNYALNDVANEQGGIVRIGDASTFHNISATHSINFTERNLSINTAINGTYNTIGKENVTTWGPVLSIAKYYFDKTLNARIAAGYNNSSNTTSKTGVTNLRGAVSYTLKERHNFDLNAIQLLRNGGSGGNLSEFTATFGYHYTFGLKKPKLNKKDNNHLRFSYRKYTFEGSPPEITVQLNTIAKEKEADAMVQQKKRRIKTTGQSG